ncbi:hypothetical protein [Cryptosporangium sp. NPDC048952]|uniref:hypothetical protein n=1 Tax=Cryptosporangium sp. NPDC048952 TaxID=3363961 RepID=UPI00371DBFF1
MANNALSNFVADSMSFTSAPTVRRELAVTVSTLIILGVAWIFVDNQGFLTVFSIVVAAYLAIRLVLSARKQASAKAGPR